jgi:ribosomal protein L36
MFTQGILEVPYREILHPHPVMVLGLISLAATVPMVATSVLSLQSQAENTKSHGLDAEWKTEKCHIKCQPSARTPDDRKELFKDCRVVLRDGKVYVQLSSYRGEQLHPFSGYFLPYPDSDFEGLVSTISDEPPQLNWIYLDTGSNILQINHGLRAEAERGLTGPWGARVCSEREIRFLMENWEGFIAVETGEAGLWALCFDRYDDGLQGKLGGNLRTVELELIREAIDG